MTAAAIPLTQAMMVRPLIGWKLKLLLFLMKYTLFATLLVTVAFYIVTATTQVGAWAREKAETGYVYALSYLPQTQVLQFVQAAQVPIEQVLDQVSFEMKFDPTILRAIAQKESGGYNESNRVKDEPQLLRPWVDRAGKAHGPQIVPPDKVNGQYLNDIEKLLWASSHGVLQVIYGFHYKTCGLGLNEWDKLHDPLTNVRCGAKVLKLYADRYRATVPDQTKRLWLALRDYNNSDAYANEVMSRIAQMRKFNYGDGI